MFQEVCFSQSKKSDLLDKSNHGLIIGGVKSGKSTALQRLAESYSKIGVPVITCDTTSRLSGLASKIVNNQEIYSENLVRFFDPLKNKGIPLNTSISEIGPLLLARMLDLTPTQSGVLNICFAIADDNHLIISNFDDLRTMLKHLKDNAKSYELDYGYASTRSIGSIQRKLLTYQREGLDKFFTLPSIDIFDFLKTQDKVGLINILSLDKIRNHSLVYSTLILFILSSLYSKLPLSKKLKLVVLIDEADHLFNNIDKTLSDKLREVISSLSKRGVSVYFSIKDTTKINRYINDLLVNKIILPISNHLEYNESEIKRICRQISHDNYDKVFNQLQRLELGQALVSFVNKSDDFNPPEVINIAKPESKIGCAELSIINSLTKNSSLYEKYGTSDPYELKLPKQVTSSTKDDTNFNKKLLRDTIQTAARTFGRYLGNSLARNVLEMLEDKVESLDE
ncbi:MAG: helicase HerA-like domain-containing protein [Halanaerobiales bacterium]